MTERDNMPDSAHKTNTLLEVKDLQMYFPIRKGFMRRQIGVVRAVDGLNFSISFGETMSLVGESGCGKTTTGRCIVRAYQPTQGSIGYRRSDDVMVDLAQLEGAGLKPYRREIRMIFQDPYSSLNPRFNVLDLVGEPLRVNENMKGKELEDCVAGLLKQCGLRPEYMHRYPHAFSGGERQRIGIARALALNPRLVICDEAVSALDLSVRAQILNLLQDLQQTFHLTYLFIAHDLSVVEHVSDRVAVMYVGQLVELAETEALYLNPQHPYTEALLSAVPKPDPRLRAEHLVLEGEVADPANPPSGCYFHPRCRYAQDICSKETPRLRDTGGGHLVACHLAEQLSLHGITTIASAN
jgi:peptide/nickel transport system ATP-binding protein